MFESADDQDEMTVRLAEIIKAKSSEYHQCESRIENLTKKLQGDRGERMKNKQKENASFLSIVQLFQEEEERANMVRIAEMQKELIKEEAQKIEGMSAWKARVLGINIDDVL
jgi:Skp family chaperone for outer membrane proteins